MARRAELLEFAVLGLLHETPMHGYELRKRLNAALGAFRALSYGSLYPCLRELLGRGLIAEAAPGSLPHSASGPSVAAPTKRARIVYELTAEGKERFQDLTSQSGPAAWEDDEFDVHFAFFARTEAEVRLRILEGRRSRLQQRLESVKSASARNRERMDAYTDALHRYGLESVEREVRWLDELITAERSTPERNAPERSAPERTTAAGPG